MTAPARYVGLSEETTYAESPAPPAVVHVDIASSGLDVPDSPELVYGGGLRRAPTLHRPGFYQPAGNFAYAIDIRTIVRILRWAMGGYAFTDDVSGDLNMHEVFAGDDVELPSFCARVGKDLFEHVFSGCCVNGLQLEVAGEFAMVTVDVLAARDAKDDQIAFEDLLLPAEYPLAFHEVYMDLPLNTDVSARVESMTLNLNNNLRGEKARGLGSRFAQKVPPTGDREITIATTVKFDDTNEYERFWGSPTGPAVTGTVEFPVRLRIDAGEDGEALLDFPRMIYSQVQAQPSGRDPIDHQVTMRAFSGDTELADMTEVNTELLATVTNTEDDVRPLGS